MTDKIDRRKFNPGRPPLSPDPVANYSLKMTQAQRAKLERLGGAAWIRKRIDRAKDNA